MISVPSKPPFQMYALSDMPSGELNELHRASWEVAVQGLECTPANQEGYFYHVPEHPEGVLMEYSTMGVVMVELGLISVRQYYRGIPAAATHDAVFDKAKIGTGENEIGSGLLLRKNMEVHSVFTEEDVDESTGMVKATTFLGVGPNGIISSADPNKPNEVFLVELDIRYLGDYWDVAKTGIDNYFKETLGGEPVLGNQVYYDYAVSEVSLFLSQKFATPPVKARFNKASSNGQILQSLINQFNS